MPPTTDAASARRLEPDLQRAISALRAGRAAEAERLAADVLERRQGDGLAAKILAQALLGQERPAEAIAHLRQALKKDKDPELYILLGRALGVMGLESDAFQALNEAIAYRPLIPQAFLGLADYLTKLGRANEAVAVLEEGLSLSADDPLLCLGLGYLHLRRQEPTRAISHFARVHSAAPDRYDALVGLALSKMLCGEFRDAQELLRHAIGLRPHDPTTRLNFAKCLLELGENAAGEDAMREAGAAGAPLSALLTAIADTARGRLFIRPTAARTFLDGQRR